MAKHYFLGRTVKKDSKGFYLNYGGYRLRPLEKTSFKDGQLVSMTMIEEGNFKDISGMKVFDNLQKYEFWISRKKREDSIVIGDVIYSFK